MIKSVLECVPNFSEGRDAAKIQAIAAEIEKVEGVKLLHVDVGYDANRTVMTFAGAPDAVCEAAFKAVSKASEVIDMRRHQGVHPRFGATDVLPLVPVSGISMAETVTLARALGKRIGEELGIHVYCYEYAAFDTKRQNLAACRAGEYEGLPVKIADPQWKPDFGPLVWNTQSGAVAVGARNFLLAYNINLDTSDVTIAKAIAAEIRESGKWITSSSDHNTKKNIPGTLKAVKAIGWYIPNYGKAQVSANLTDIDQTPVHVVFEEVKKWAALFGVHVTGSEIIGLTPLRVMLEAGKFYAAPATETLSSSQLILLAIQRLGLDELAPFDYSQRILELALQSSSNRQA
jgi:glutamate formiminotransferase / formiminotetrahydrofolate cyclodeaminase